MPDLMIVRTIVGVMPNQASTGRNYWDITDDQGQTWKAWESQTGVAAGQLVGQLAQMKVQVKPAANPQFGMNYVLKQIMPAPPGSQPSPPLDQMLMQQPQMQPQQPNLGVQQNPYGTQPITMGPPQQTLIQQAMQNTQKTMGQGGNFSDADLTRIARSTAISAAVGAAFTPEDFRDQEDVLDWERVYAVAEAITKFVLFRRHEGWNPGVEITPTTAEVVQMNEQQVLAEVQSQFPGTTQQGIELPDIASDAGADSADGGDVGWGE